MYFSSKSCAFWGLLLSWLLMCVGVPTDPPELRLGVGRADITGPAADVNFMGYAKPGQKAAGIHTRLFSRAFVLESQAAPHTRVVYVSIDACMTSQLVTLKVIERLRRTYGELYTERNTMISGIHTHSGPGGFLQYVLYDIPSLGFVQESLDAIVDGIVQSVQRAHDDLRPGRVFFNEGLLLDANINRSPSAYLENPAEERARYQHDVDKVMVQLRLEDGDGSGRGSINWFAVHCTSMNNTNQLISSDNKGAASLLMEEWARRSRAQAPAQGSEFVAAFAQANVGDSSPNTEGAFCTDSGLPCEMNTSTCNRRSELCNGRGPGWPDHFQSTRIIAERQLAKAKQLYNDASTELRGGLDFRHMYVDMSSVSLDARNASGNATTCKPALGYSFAAGTTDGPGAFDFTQGSTSGNPFWDTISHLLRDPTQEQIECQHPKPVLLDTGEMNVPGPWQPSVVSVQILRIGQLLVVGVPAEFTTMAGRRLRNAVREAFGAKMKVVISGLSNAYSSYVTTFEEYQVQRYEGASTLYGPHTLAAYLQLYRQLATAMASGEEVPEGPAPPDLSEKIPSFVAPVVTDSIPKGAHYGGIVMDVRQRVFRAGDVVSATFHSACPRNNRRPGGTFLTVERKLEPGRKNTTSLNSIVSSLTSNTRGRGRKEKYTQELDTQEGWEVVHDDSDWSTKFSWFRPGSVPLFRSQSHAVISWEIPATVHSGVYRLRHFGTYKHITGLMHDFDGVSSVFEVLAANSFQEW